MTNTMIEQLLKVSYEFVVTAGQQAANTAAFTYITSGIFHLCWALFFTIIIYKVCLPTVRKINPAKNPEFNEVAAVLGGVVSAIIACVTYCESFTEIQQGMCWLLFPIGEMVHKVLL